MASYVLRSDDQYFMTTELVYTEGDWTWTSWKNRGVYMEGVRRLLKEGFDVSGFVLPDNHEIAMARYMISYKTDDELQKIEEVLLRTGLSSISRLQYVDEQKDTKTLIFYLLP